MTDKPLLIADIGGTNARFAIASEKSPYFDNTQTLQCADFETIEQAIDAYLTTNNISSLRGLCFAVAGPIKGESVRFTNNHWVINRSDIKKFFKTNLVQLLNDFESIAYSLPQMHNSDLSPISFKKELTLDTSADYTVAVLGPGSGLGIAGLCHQNKNLRPLSTEGGHTGFAPDNTIQDQLLDSLRQKFERVSNERLLSGPGLVNIYEALCEINAQPNIGLSPADIAVCAREKSDPICIQTMALFFQVLGQVAGDTALSLGAYQGIYIGGGIVQRYPQQLALSQFRAGFENKGRYRSTMQKIPTWLITHKNAGLLGASIYARTML